MLQTFEDLIAALDRAHIPHVVDTPSQTVEVPAGAAGQGLMLLIRWLPGQDLLQLLLPLAILAPDDRVPAMLDAINRVNHALVMPGLCLEPRRHLVFYRLVVPRRVPEGSLSEPELRAAMQTALNTARDFAEPLRLVAMEGVAPEQILERAAALRGH